MKYEQPSITVMLQKILGVFFFLIDICGLTCVLLLIGSFLSYFYLFDVLKKHFDVLKKMF